MRSKLFAPIGAFMAISVALSLAVNPVADAAPKKLKLLWSDEFNGKKGARPSAKVWSAEIGGGGWGNSERQYYTDKSANASMDGAGRLIITADRISNEYAEQIGTVPGTEDILNRCSECQFTSARLKTARKLSFMYGRVEARIKMPVGVGTWPAFWMLGQNIDQIGWPKSGEIDILEYIGKEPHMVFTTLHTQDSHGNTINTKKTKFPTIEEGFHVFALDWTKDKMEFYVDDTLVYTFQPKVKNDDTWPFNKPFYFILNVAIGGNFGGPAVDDSIFPQDFIIDYVKVYQ